MSRKKKLEETIEHQLQYNKKHKVTKTSTKWNHDAMQRVRRERADPCIILNNNVLFSLVGFYKEAHRRLASYRLKAFTCLSQEEHDKKERKKLTHTAHTNTRKISNGSVKFPKGKQQL